MTHGTIFSLKRIGKINRGRIEKVQTDIRNAVEELTKNGKVEAHALERFIAEQVHPGKN